VCKDLEKRGVTTPAGDQWRTSTLRTSMMRPMLAGLRTYHGETIADGDWERIITREQHDQLVARFTGKGRAKPTGSLLGGGCCGAADAGFRWWPPRTPATNVRRCAWCTGAGRATGPRPVEVSQWPPATLRTTRPPWR